MNEYVHVVPLCAQCGGAANICEQPDSTCRLRDLAREWASDGYGADPRDPIAIAVLDDAARKLAPLLRQIEDGAWTRLSEARTRRVEKLEEGLRGLFVTYRNDIVGRGNGLGVHPSSMLALAATLLDMDLAPLVLEEPCCEEADYGHGHSENCPTHADAEDAPAKCEHYKTCRECPSVKMADGLRAEEDKQRERAEKVEARVAMALAYCEAADLPTLASVLRGEKTWPATASVSEMQTELDRPEEEVDAELRSMGVDPERLAARGLAFVAATKKEIVDEEHGTQGVRRVPDGNGVAVAVGEAHGRAAREVGNGGAGVAGGELSGHDSAGVSEPRTSEALRPCMRPAGHDGDCFFTMGPARDQCPWVLHRDDGRTFTYCTHENGHFGEHFNGDGAWLDSDPRCDKWEWSDMTFTSGSVRKRRPNGCPGKRTNEAKRGSCAVDDCPNNAALGWLFCEGHIAEYGLKKLPDEERGLYRKYKIERTDGSSAPGGKHEVCEYFVLDLKHDPHAFAALMAYADSCKEEYPLLASDLRRRAAGERSDELSSTTASVGDAPAPHDETCAAQDGQGTCCTFLEGHNTPHSWECCYDCGVHDGHSHDCHRFRRGRDQAKPAHLWDNPAPLNEATSGTLGAVHAALLSDASRSSEARNTGKPTCTCTPMRTCYFCENDIPTGARSNDATGEDSRAVAGKLTSGVRKVAQSAVRDGHTILIRDRDFDRLTALIGIPPVTDRPLDKPMAANADSAWFDLEIAAEAHVKHYDGPGTAIEHAAALKVAALAYARCTDYPLAADVPTVATDPLEKRIAALAHRTAKSFATQLADIVRSQQPAPRSDSATLVHRDVKPENLPDRGRLIAEHSHLSMYLTQLRAELPEIEKTARKTPRRDMLDERAKVEQAKASVEVVREHIAKLETDVAARHEQLVALGAYGANLDVPPGAAPLGLSEEPAPVRVQERPTGSTTNTSEASVPVARSSATREGSAVHLGSTDLPAGTSNSRAAESPKSGAPIHQRTETALPDAPPPSYCPHGIGERACRTRGQCTIRWRAGDRGGL